MSWKIFLIWLLSPFLLSAKDLKESKIIICGIARNVEKAIPATIRSIQTIGEHFGDYRVFIYENNSTDNTAKKFREWQARNPRVTLISENLSDEDFFVQEGDVRRKIYKTEILAKGRNLVVGKALQQEFDDYEYILMADMDFARPWFIEGILTSFDFNEEWDAITANGIMEKGDYWDWYAFRHPIIPFGPELYGPSWWSSHRKWRSLIQFNLSDPFFRVQSAFGGLAIYKRASVQNAFYSGVVTPDLEELMQGVIDANDERSKSFISWHQQQLGLVPSIVLPGGRIHWFMDVTMRYLACPTVCEHVTFHATMIKNGHGKIFVNPRMIMKYWECSPRY